MVVELRRKVRRLGDVPIRDFAKAIRWGLGAWIWTTLLLLLIAWIVISVAAAVFGFHRPSWFLVAGILAIFAVLTCVPILVAMLTEYAAWAEHKGALCVELRRLLVDSLGGAEHLDYQCLLNLKWHGMRAVVGEDEEGRSVRILDADGVVYGSSSGLRGHRDRLQLFDAAARAWIEAAKALQNENSNGRAELSSASASLRK